MTKNEKAMKQARTACVFCAGFSTAAACLAALYRDLWGFLTAAGITAIILFTKKFILED